MLPEHRRMANSVSDFLKNKRSNIMSERLPGSCFKVSHEACLKFFLPFRIIKFEARGRSPRSQVFSASARHLKNFDGFVFVSIFSYESPPGCGAVSISSTTLGLIFSSTKPKGSNRQENGPISSVFPPKRRGTFWYLKNPWNSWLTRYFRWLIRRTCVQFTCAYRLPISFFLNWHSPYRSFMIEWLLFKM